MCFFSQRHTFSGIITFSGFIRGHLWGDLQLISECRRSKGHIFLTEQTVFYWQTHIDPSSGTQLWPRSVILISLLLRDARKKRFSSLITVIIQQRNCSFLAELNFLFNKTGKKLFNHSSSIYLSYRSKVNIGSFMMHVKQIPTETIPGF